MLPRDYQYPRVLSQPKYGAAQGAFTLVEVLISLAIVGFMLSVAYGSVSSVIRSKNLLTDEQEVVRIEHVMVRRMVRELQLSYLGVPRLPPRDDLEKRFHSTENLFGEEKRLPNGRPGDEITFIALSAGQYFLDSRPTNNGLVQISYRVLEDPENENPNDFPVYSLIREEVPYITPYEKAYEDAVRFPLLENVESFKLEYFDMKTQEWRRSWGEDDAHAELPGMVRFTIDLRSPQGKPQQITGTAALRARRIAR
ncbi:MAG: prepilin-type N-terminal cleavage/methylation domain-containing protein [Bdellovibrionales bacterium]|nr:prepilin-type N-terminal cleavage/methylation domain-containing protein [Bdellovibrionales bacterium]